MTLNTVTITPPKDDEVQIKQNVIGFNYMDIYQRSGLYPLELPSGIGLEAAGIVQDIGKNVTEFRVGDRVAYATAPQGAYAEYRNFPAARVVHLPDEMSDEKCAATLFKGMTVEYLLNRCYDIKSDEKVLFLGSGGGVGTLAGQWGNSKGAYMIGVDGGEEKCQLARDSGYAEVIDFTKEDVVERVREITEGRGVPVVYDPIGGPTYQQTLDCLGPRGYFVSFGTTGGPMPAVDPPILQKRDSLYFTRPTVATYTAKREDLVLSANSVFEMVSSNKIKVEIGQRYSLDEAVKVHEETEAGKTKGSSILVP
ncbi:MAG: quinone oxidoreductase [Rhodospirillaceae bacterium]|nr:quinone oxidoreductase [Rhodospirillaceae bacterium]OUT79235.1 MAG: quinone oxidoreductase [Rhodospirillaceae bacterium TMED23]